MGEITDADRWAYIRDVLAQSHSLKMDGNHSYRFRRFPMRGPNFTAAVDAAIEAGREVEAWVQKKK